MTVDAVIEKLNQYLKLDPEAISQLVQTRVSCNQDMANHEGIQVYSNDGLKYRIGVLGLLNGLYGTIQGGTKDGWGHIAVLIEDDKIVDFFDMETLNVRDGDVQ